ncbi:Lrp/AsnC family transcriptional regulator [Maribacter luteus]|uniref:Winged helix-turn-helix transcriptional regulator n=1 Tax=Maribacter luteus TaxID=2594478 RepID=A0A6I2MQW7_9FLAO|nr:Lrp/AsnC family transcriptional regulator [Maribacter luteus]MRX64840.1 winged helix-turn-helix transcriptional regulator [Maribacter luteus]|tara:strand:- start:454 stop:912 length:459 start_codon:yes stop_codon:yes gene_type:complete
MKFDEVDIKLLGLLQENSKKTTKEYANKLNLSVTAVYERIKRLEKTGVIKNYVALVDKKKVNKAFVVLCHVKLTQHAKAYVLQFEKEVQQLQEVVECYHTSGDYDYILKIYVRDMEAYRDFMVTKLTALNHIGSTQSSFVINEVKHTTRIPL